MKRIFKIFALSLLFTFLFTSGAMAVDTSNESSQASKVASIAGATRIFEDIEGENFSVQNRLTPAITGTTISQGSVPSAMRADSLKFGHYRSIESTDHSNTYAEWRFHTADPTTINGKEDAYIILGKRSYDITNFSYQVIEFDLTTMTTFPSNLWIFSEWRGSDNSGKERVKFGSYDDTDGLWHFGDKTIEIKKNEWAHITLVFAIRRTGEDAYDFSSTVARIFVNGEFFNEITPYPSASLKSGVTLRQHYVGVGWPYGKGGIRTGMDENASVCLDNVSLTTFDRSTYSGNLEKVFASDFTSLSSFDGAEFLYHENYTFPSASLAVSTVEDKDGNKTLFPTVEEALSYVEKNALQNAKVTLLADQYHPLEISTPLTLDLNGHTLYGDATTGDNVVLSSVDGNVWTFTETTEKTAHISFYQSPFANRSTPVADFLYTTGDTVATLTPEPFVNPETGAVCEPTGKWLVYDLKGNLITTPPTTITASHLGNTYIFCPEYYSKSICFTLIKADGTIEQHETLDLLYEIPEGATVILRKDTPAPKSFYGKNYKLDLNGYTVYTLDGAKQDIIRGSGAVYVYSSRPGARIFTGSYMKNGQKDANGNPIYTNQAAFVVTDANATSGTEFMIGYKNQDEATPYRIDMFCGVFAQLSNISSISLYVRNTNIVSAAGDNKMIFTTRNQRAGRYWQFDDCDILITNSKALCGNVDVGVHTGTYVFNNTNIRGNGSLFGVERSMMADCNVTFNNTSVYGSHKINAGKGTYTDASGVVYEYMNSLTIQGKCVITDIQSEGVTLPADTMYIPKVSVSVSGYFSFPNYAQYVNFERGNYSTIGGAYTAKGYIGSISEYSGSLKQSVAIDSSVSVLIYLPKSTSIEGVYLGEENLLDTTKTKVIGGDDYFVVRINTPPKEAYKEQTIFVRFKGSTIQIPLEASLVGYAQKLNQITDTTGTGSYYTDSKALMKYVLYYIRTASTSIGTATASDLAKVDAILGTFSPTTADKTIEETIYTTTSVSGKLTAATLNLDAEVGMVFRVAGGFVGTIRVDMPHSVSKIKTYTGEAPADSSSYVILSEIPAYALREDVTVTITSSGSTTTFTYNLATYVNGTKTDIAYAVYAYAKQASAYHTKYPTASVYGD